MQVSRCLICARDLWDASSVRYVLADRSHEDSMSVRLNLVCWAMSLLLDTGVWGILDTRGQVDNLTFFLGADTSPVLSDAGALAYSTNSAMALFC